MTFKDEQLKLLKKIEQMIAETEKGIKETEEDIRQTEERLKSEEIRQTITRKVAPMKTLTAEAFVKAFESLWKKYASYVSEVGHKITSLKKQQTETATFISRTKEEIDGFIRDKTNEALAQIQKGIEERTSFIKEATSRIYNLETEVNSLLEKILEFQRISGEIFQLLDYSDNIVVDKRGKSVFQSEE